MLKKFEKAVLIGFLCTVILSLAGFTNQCEILSSKILRLHIIANSDSEFDQKLKLKVRDKILNVSASLFESATDAENAAKIINESLTEIVECAKKEVKVNGFDYNVTARVQNVYFNTRVYENCTLPAGFYNALQISIGEGKGKNWWCVIFPPMCVPTALEHQELEDILNPEELEIIEESERYELKFMFLEVLNEIKSFFFDIFNVFENFFF
ncbi:stage II sporulation protein R [Clostridia bacterium]|nr:stage II sporulation protein R [Clostridia bacterium]